jgi:hypothetical protein
MTLKVGYEKLHRSAEFHAPDVPPDDPSYQHICQAFDVAAKDRDTYGPLLISLP